MLKSTLFLNNTYQQLQHLKQNVREWSSIQPAKSSISLRVHSDPTSEPYVAETIRRWRVKYEGAGSPSRIDEMSGSKAWIPCGWHQRKQARRRGTNVKEEARFYVEWIDPAARSTLAAAHSPSTRPSARYFAFISRRYYLRATAAGSLKESDRIRRPAPRSRKDGRRDFRMRRAFDSFHRGRVEPLCRRKSSGIGYD